MHSHTCTKVTYNQVLLFAVHVNFANRSSSGEIKLKSRFTGPESKSGTPTTGDFTLRRRSWGVPTMWRRLRSVRYPVAVRLRSLLPLTIHSITSPPLNVNWTLCISALSQSKWLIEFQRSEEEATTAHSRWWMTGWLARERVSQISSINQDEQELRSTSRWMDVDGWVNVQNRLGLAI